MGKNATRLSIQPNNSLFFLLSQNFCFQVFDEAKIIFKLNLRDQLKNVCFDLLSKIRKQ